MKQLNAQSTRVFVVLMDHLDQGYLKILNDLFMPLTVERIGEAPLAEYGIASLYSLCHYYEQNGDLMQDPEMCFAVVDMRRTDQNDPDNVLVFPYMFQQANLGIYEESISYDDNGALNQVNTKRQMEHKIFADQWIGNLKEQGFITTLLGQTDIPE